MAETSVGNEGSGCVEVRWQAWINRVEVDVQTTSGPEYAVGGYFNKTKVEYRVE